MAPKRLPNDPHPASSTSEDEEVEEDQNNATQTYNDAQISDDEDEGEEDQELNESEGEDDEEEEPKTPEKKPDQSDSRGESGSDTETESDRTLPSPTASDFTIKPVSYSKKKVSERPSSVSITATPALKRAAESELKAKDSKQKKVVTGGDDEDSKKASGFQRLWSEDDEIAILKGMIDYQSKKGSEPYADMVGFHEFIKKNLHVDASKNQLMDKIRRLKKKYLNNAEKGENGQGPIFSKPHEHKSFELSKKIWGSMANIDGFDDDAKSSKKKPRQSAKCNNSSTVLALPMQEVAPKKEAVAPKKEVVAPMKEEVALKKEEVTQIKEEMSINGDLKAEQDDFWSKFPCLKESLRLVNCSLGSEGLMNSVKVVMPLIGSSKAKELENRWRQLQIEEMELYVEKSKLIQEQGTLILDSLKVLPKC